ncbi:MAG: nonstructural protein [Microvirus sp.]|nr:MAG: nonstructural protein [Microvirus sp.]
MDKLIAVAVFDAAVGSFNRPFFVPSLGLALRSFADEVNRYDDNNPMSRHPNDFSLYKLGSYDEISGRFDSLDVPERLSLARDVQILED